MPVFGQDEPRHATWRRPGESSRSNSSCFPRSADPVSVATPVMLRVGLARPDATSSPSGSVTSATSGIVGRIALVGRELGVRYVLEGSARRSGERLRLTGQLIDADDG